MPANTFVATPLAAVRAGLRPVFVDVDPDTLLLDPAKLDDAIGAETSALTSLRPEASRMSAVKVRRKARMS